MTYYTPSWTDPNGCCKASFGKVQSAGARQLVDHAAVGPEMLFGDRTAWYSNSPRFVLYCMGHVADHGGLYGTQAANQTSRVSC